MSALGQKRSFPPGRPMPACDPRGAFRPPMTWLPHVKESLERMSMGSSGSVAQRLHSLRHIGQRRRGTRLEFLHHMGAVNFHGLFGDAQIMRDLFVQSSVADMPEHVPLPV